MTDRNRWFALGVLCVGMLMIVLDNTVVNVALPSIEHDLGFTRSGLAWVVNAYMIAFGGLLLLAGRLGDLIGARRVFTIGLVAFTLASTMCGLAWSAEALVVARFVQGIGGALASSVILAMIFTTFEEPFERAKAMGYFSFTAAAGGSIGLLVGGALTQLLDWHWVFLVNVPIGIVALILTRRYVKGGGGIGIDKGADAIGALLITSALMLAVYTVVGGPDASPARTLMQAGLAVLLLATFVRRQATARLPLLPLHLFRSRNLTGSNVMQILVVAAMFGFFFLDSLYMRRVLGYGPIATGLAFLPVTVAIGALSLGWGARLGERFGAKPVTIAGVAMATAGIGAFAFFPRDAGYFVTMLPAMLLLGAGLGGSFPSVMMFAMADATPETSGVTSGLINTAANVGGALGLAVLATIPEARVAFAVAAGLLICAGVVAATVLRPESLGSGFAGRNVERVGAKASRSPVA